MIAFLNPLLLLGLLGIALPILIHLLMRQRPRPRPWAAMRWLQAAMQVAQRRYRLTNLLLLLLRCLAALLIALAVARPAISGLGQSGDLVLVVDITTSMGATASARPLSTLAANLDAAGMAQGEVTIITVGREVLLRHRGSWREGLRFLDNVEVDTYAGGLDLAASGERAQALIDVLPNRATVILVSDFRQDRGEGLREMLDQEVAELRVLRVGNDLANALVVEVEPPLDLQPGQPGALRVRVQGDVLGARLRINDGSSEAISFVEQGDDADQWRRLALPPLPAGRHLLHLMLEDVGLQADNLFEYPIFVRDRIAALTVGDGLSLADVALEADPLRVDHRRVSAQALSTTPLPPSGGVVVLRDRAPQMAPIEQWLSAGGIVWSDWHTLLRDAQMADRINAAVQREEGAANGRLRSSMLDLDENFARTVVSESARLKPLLNGAEVLLSVEDDPLVLALPVGQGWLVVEGDDLSRNPEIRTTGAIPEWVVRTVRRLAARQHQQVVLMSGSPAPRDSTINRGGQSVSLRQGEAAHLHPGWWPSPEGGSGGSGLVVLANAAEGELRALPGTEGWSDLQVLAPPSEGADWSWWLLLALMLLLLSEGAVAAWAGRTYGR